MTWGRKTSHQRAELSLWQFPGTALFWETRYVWAREMILPVLFPSGCYAGRDTQQAQGIRIN